MEGDVDARSCLDGKATGRKTLEEGCEQYMKERRVFEEKISGLHGCGIKFGMLDIARKQSLLQEIDGDHRRRKNKGVRYVDVLT